MPEIHFLDLLKHKHFGPITLGDNKERVIQFLGEPTDYSNPELSPETFDAIYYGRFQFNFIEEKLNSISHAHILDLFTWRFEEAFHFKNDLFQFTTWFKDPTIDTRLENFKNKHDSENIFYTEDIFYDSIRLKIGEDLTLLFCGVQSFHKDPSEWTAIDPEILDLKLASFYLGS
jgi:hypothetical protein